MRLRCAARLRGAVVALGVVTALATLPATVAGQDATVTVVASDEVERWPPIATFSILGYDPETG